MNKKTYKGLYAYVSIYVYIVLYFQNSYLFGKYTHSYTYALSKPYSRLYKNPFSIMLLSFVNFCQEREDRIKQIDSVAAGRVRVFSQIR